MWTRACFVIFQFLYTQFDFCKNFLPHLQWFFSPSGLREGRNPDPQVLLPRAPLSGGKLPHVSGGDRESSKGKQLHPIGHQAEHSVAIWPKMY